jgi:TM2 domain-containing membrane protein YozV
MPYCSKCGNQMREGSQFCDRCGTSLHPGGPGPYQQSGYSGNQYSATFTMPRDEKEPIIAVILSIFLPGVGQMYVGKVLRGVLILLFLLIFSVLSFLPALTITDEAGFYGFLWWSIIASIIIIVVYVWQIVDAYKLAEDHNRHNAPPRRY